MNLKVKMFRFCEHNQFYREIPLSSPWEDKPYENTCNCKLPTTSPKSTIPWLDTTQDFSQSHISYIIPKTTTATEILEDVFEGNPSLYYKHTEFRKTFDPSHSNHFETINCDIDNIVYHKLLNPTGALEGVEFHLLGHGFTSLPQDLVIHAKHLKEIHFNGHMSYVTPAFQIIGDLPSLQKVNFSIGHQQHPFFLEIFDKAYSSSSLELLANPGVQELHVTINNRAFVSGSEMDMMVILDILDLIFYRVTQCLPNLAQVELHLPASPLAAAVFKGIVFNARFQPHIKLSVTVAAAEVGMMMLKCSVPRKPHKEYPLFATIRGNFEKSTVKDTFEHNLKSLFYKLDDLAELLEEFRKAQTAQRLMGSPDFPGFVSDPPPGFEQWFTQIPVFSCHHSRSEEVDCPEASGSTGPEKIDSLLKSLILSEQAIAEHMQGMKVALPLTWIEKVGHYLGIN